MVMPGAITRTLPAASPNREAVQAVRGTGLSLSLFTFTLSFSAPMKKPSLLPVLAFTAGLGATVFLTISMPSCGSRNGAAEKDGPARQYRAFVAAVQSDPETLR